MKGTLEITPDQLAQIVCGVLAENGYEAAGLALYMGDQLVGYDRAVLPLEIPKGVEIFPRPKSTTREDIDRMLNPYVAPTTFATRNGTAETSGTPSG